MNENIPYVLSICNWYANICKSYSISQQYVYVVHNIKLSKLLKTFSNENAILLLKFYKYNLRNNGENGINIRIRTWFIWGW